MKVMKQAIFLIFIIFQSTYQISFSDSLLVLNDSLKKIQSSLHFSHILNPDIKGLKDLLQPSLKELLNLKNDLTRRNIVAVQFDALINYYERGGPAH